MNRIVAHHGKCVGYHDWMNWITLVGLVVGMRLVFVVVNELVVVEVLSLHCNSLFVVINQRTNHLVEHHKHHLVELIQLKGTWSYHRMNCHQMNYHRKNYQMSYRKNRQRIQYFVDGKLVLVMVTEMGMVVVHKYLLDYVGAMKEMKRKY